MNIIDCFIFFNEVDLLLYRLHLLYDVVDKFILVESAYTFMGLKKESFFKKNIHKFSKFLDKIIHINLDTLPYLKPVIRYSYSGLKKENELGEQWKNEIYQRNSIINGLNKLDLTDEDIIIIGDADEIVNPSVLNKIKKKELTINISSLDMDCYYYNLRCKRTQWQASKICNFKTLKEYKNIDTIRKLRGMPVIPNSGWHLSYFGDEKFIELKLQNFSHQEYNNKDITQNIIKRINNGEDLFGRKHHKITLIDINDNNNLPPKYDIYLKKYI